MKNIAAVIFTFLFFFKIFGQDNTRHYRQALFDLQNAQAQQLGVITGNSDTHKKYSNGTRNRMELGATLLYNNWDNSGKIFTTSKEFSFDQIDIDLATGTVLIQVEEEIFSFSSNKIKKIVINGKIYKILYDSSTGENQFFEVVHSENEFAILKGFKLIYKKASPHAMFNTGQKNSLRRQEVFYLKTPKGLERIKLSKKNIQRLLEEKDFKALRNKSRRIVLKSN